jgi:hypothetical protein
MAAETAAAVGEHPLQHVVGRRVPGGSYAVAGYEGWLLRDAVYAEQSETVHPIAAFIGVQRGMGITVAELFTMLESDIADGPMLAECTIALAADVVPGRRYRVMGEVTGIVRKHGAALGAFDLVTCRFDLSEEDGGAPVAVVTNVYAIVRKDVT